MTASQSSDLPRQAKDLTGIKPARLTAVSFSHLNKHNQAMWNCVCDCGNKKIVNATKLSSGWTKSCGCLAIEEHVKAGRKRGEAFRTHGATGSPEYISYRGMRDRCLNKNTIGFKNYGGRGITVCGRWLESFENFIADMGLMPSPGLSIERKNTNLGYFPGNCKWASRTEQNRNRRGNVMICVNGETRCVAEWAEAIGVTKSLIRNRIRSGKSPESVISDLLARVQDGPAS